MSLTKHITLFTYLACQLAAGPLQSQTISRDIFVDVLRDGGFIIVMRHASSPRQPPEANAVNPDNIKRERQLDESGRRSATSMGEALRRLQIPVVEVVSSPAYRALETARLIGFTDPSIINELSNEGMGASGVADAAWLRIAIALPVPNGNRILITHGPNISGAFPEYSQGMSEGEALVFDPRGMAGPIMIYRIRIDEWNDL